MGCWLKEFVLKHIYNQAGRSKTVHTVQRYTCKRRRGEISVLTEVADGGAARWHPGAAPGHRRDLWGWEEEAKQSLASHNFSHVEELQILPIGTSSQHRRETRPSLRWKTSSLRSPLPSWAAHSPSQIRYLPPPKLMLTARRVIKLLSCHIFNYKASLLAILKNIIISTLELNKKDWEARTWGSRTGLGLGFLLIWTYLLESLAAGDRASLVEESSIDIELGVDECRSNFMQMVSSIWKKHWKALKEIHPVGLSHLLVGLSEKRHGKRVVARYHFFTSPVKK